MSAQSANNSNASYRPDALPILELLEADYGRAQWFPRQSPVEELVSCILSQHTSDINSGRAYANLTAVYPTWNAVLNADTAELANVIRSGGLADTKAPRIQAVLRAILRDQGEITLDALDAMSDAEARKYLISLPGVGPKTAAIVLCFALGRPVMPVDTHIFRVAWRLGFIEKRIGEAKAHDALQAQIAPELVFRFHVALITHGRRVCKALQPQCPKCRLATVCRTRRQAVSGEGDSP